MLPSRTNNAVQLLAIEQSGCECAWLIISLRSSTSLAAGRVCPSMLEPADTQPIAALCSAAKTRLGMHHPDGQMLQIGTDPFFPFVSMKEDESNYLRTQSGLNARHTQVPMAKFVSEQEVIIDVTSPTILSCF